MIILVGSTYNLTNLSFLLDIYAKFSHTFAGYKASLEGKRYLALQAVWICTAKAGTSRKQQKMQRPFWGLGAFSTRHE